MQLQNELPLACTLGAIDAPQRAAHYASAQRLMSVAVQERQELVDGYALRYQASDYADLVTFIDNERLCCPFFRFNLDVAPAQGPIWLRITGEPGVKEFFDTLFTGQ